MKNAKYTLDEKPIDETCGCPVCRSFTRAYIHHLFKSEEMLGMRLAVMHNLWFYNDLTEKLRSALDTDTFEDFYNDNIENLGKRI